MAEGTGGGHFVDSINVPPRPTPPDVAEGTGGGHFVDSIDVPPRPTPPDFSVYLFNGDPAFYYTNSIATGGSFSGQCLIARGK